MKIEVSDRNIVLVQVEKRLQSIYDARLKRDHAYEEAWRKRTKRGFFGLGGREPGPEEKPPHVDFFMGSGWDYPCTMLYYQSEDTLDNIKKALLSPGTGTILLDGEDIRELGFTNIADLRLK